MLPRMAQNPPHSALAFGEFLLEPHTRRLLRAGEPVHLTPKALDLLMFLLSRRPDAVSKDEIHTHLWPGTFVSDTNLTALVFEVRQALGESARQQAYIRTVQRFGYAFDAQAVPWLAAGRVIHRDVEVVLVPGENVLGRSRGATVRVDSPKVSRRHAVIRVSGLTSTLEDCGSRHGTFLGGHRVTTPVPLSDGDEISLGPVALTFRTSAAQDDSEVTR
jgi:DNA-binding winged helix-turn-helix (wHTH) protein